MLKNINKKSVLQYFYSTNKGIRGTARHFRIDPIVVGKWVNQSFNR